MNTNLLNITTIPISIEVNIVNGQFEGSHTPPPLAKINTGDGGISIDAEPAKINIDTYTARQSLGYGNYNFADFNKTEAKKGIKLAYEGVAKIVNEGNKLARGTTPGELAIQNKRAGANIQTIMEFLPKEGADVTFDKGTLNINYHTKDMNFDWTNLETTPLKFVPGKIEVVVEQMPSIEIEYVGSPIYVPSSADPNYNPPPNLLDRTV